MKIRIAYLIDKIESTSSGTEKQLVYLIEGLDRTQFDPQLCVLRSTPWSEAYSKCPVHTVGIDSFKRLSSWKALFEFSKYLKTKGIDCLQTHFRDASIAGVVAAKVSGGVRVVQTRKNQGYWMSRSDSILSRVLNYGVTAFVANSDDTRQWVTKKEAVAPDRIRTIYNGLDFSVFPRQDKGVRERMRRSLGLGEQVVGVVIVANLRPIKRVDVFLEAAARVLVEFPLCVFFVVGDGECRDSLVAQASALGVLEKVRFMGKKNNVPELLSAMDIGVLTSDSESFSNSVLEYLAAGLTVVSTNVGGGYEVLGGNGFGALVPPGDSVAIAVAIRTFCIDKDRRQSNRVGAPKMIQQRFSMDSYVSSYEQLYRDVVFSGGEM